MKKMSRKQLAVPVPQDQNQLEDTLTQILATQRMIENVKADRVAEIEKINQKVRKKLRPLEERLKKMAKAVLTYATAHFDELTESGKRSSVELALDIIVRWYKTQWSVQLLKPEKTVIAELQKKGFTEFLRSPPPEIDKRAMVKNIKKAAFLKLVKFIKKKMFAIKTPAGTLPLTLETYTFPDF